MAAVHFLELISLPVQLMAFHRHQIGRILLCLITQQLQEEDEVTIRGADHNRFAANLNELTVLLF